MIGWVARGLLLAAGTIAGWIVAKDAPAFGVVQGVVAMLLLVLIVGVLSYWPERKSRQRDRTDERR